MNSGVASTIFNFEANICIAQQLLHVEGQRVSLLNKDTNKNTHNMFSLKPNKVKDFLLYLSVANDFLHGEGQGVSLLKQTREINNKAFSLQPDMVKDFLILLSSRREPPR